MDTFDAEFVGLFIGEGCIDIAQQGRAAHHIRPRIRIGMNQSDTPLLRSVQARYGGSISFRAATRCATWTLTGKTGLRVVVGLLAQSTLPHAKRPEVEILAKAIELHGQHEQMREYKAALSALKARYADAAHA